MRVDNNNQNAMNELKSLNQSIANAFSSLPKNPCLAW